MVKDTRFIIKLICLKGVHQTKFFISQYFMIYSFKWPSLAFPPLLLFEFEDLTSHIVIMLLQLAQ